MSEIFSSKLAPYMTGLIEQKRALGYKYNEQVKLLKKFDVFCLERFPNESTVTRDMLDIWGAMRPYALRIGHCKPYFFINRRIFFRFIITGGVLWIRHI